MIITNVSEKIFQNPAPTQYGQYVQLSDPNPSAAIIRDCKFRCIDSIKATEKHLHKKASRIKFIVHKYYEVIDPETYEKTICSIVAWKAFFK